MKPCPSSETWPRLLEGDLPEREAQTVREHVQTCTVCAAQLEETRALLGALAKPLAEPDAQRVRKVMKRVRETERQPQWSRRWVPLAVAATAALASVAVWWRPGAPGTFTARGGNTQWRQRVSVEVRSALNAGQKWAARASLMAETPLVVWYRNIEKTRPLYLAAFLVDGAGEVHWVAPAWPADEPPPLLAELPVSDSDALMPWSFIPANPAAGDGELVTWVVDEALNVEAVEQAEAARRVGTQVSLPGVVWRQPVRIEPAP
ncbi:MAG: hypothetical protein K1X64_22885 [Myxococcaceae bacterium]|nr:hypothetical protein [Myxococcaceae bacterium]